jgi:hypothetical protein
MENRRRNPRNADQANAQRRAQRQNEANAQKNVENILDQNNNMYLLIIFE